MNEKSSSQTENSTSRRYQLINPLLQTDDESLSNASAEYQQLIPIRLDLLPSASTLWNKRRRSSITHESSLIDPISSSDGAVFDHRSSSRRKRSAQDDIAAYPSPHFHRDDDRYVRVKP